MPPARERTNPTPEAQHVSTVRHRVPFYETDAMGIVHHSNYVRYLELARILWLDEYDRPYRAYMADGLHYTTTHVEVDYHRPAGYDDVVDISTWLEQVRGASLRMGYALRSNGELLATAATEHALVDDAGRPQRIPREQRERLAAAARPATERRPA